MWCGLKRKVIDRIQIDRKYIFKIEHFFPLYSVLTEIVGKWFTRKNVAGEDGIVTISKFKETTLPTSQCFCGQPS